MKISVKDGQTMMDVAVEAFGTWEAAIDMALINGMVLSEVPEDGTVLELPDGHFNLRMEQYCRTNGISPATARTEGEAYEAGIFTKQFTKQFS